MAKEIKRGVWIAMIITYTISVLFIFSGLGLTNNSFKNIFSPKKGYKIITGYNEGMTMPNGVTMVDMSSIKGNVPLFLGFSIFFTIVMLGTCAVLTYYSSGDDQ